MLQAALMLVLFIASIFLGSALGHNAALNKIRKRGELVITKGKTKGRYIFYPDVVKSTPEETGEK